MNWVDLGLLLVVLFFAAEGIKRGFFSQVVDILGFLSSFLISLTFYPIPAQLLSKFFNLPPIAANPVGFLILWLIAEGVFFKAASGLINRYLKSLFHTHINQYLGFMPAILNALLFSSFFLLFIVSLPIQPRIKKDVFDSKIGSYLVNKATIIERPLNNIFGPIAKQGLTFLTVKPEEKGSVPLQFTQKQLTNDFASEQEMFKFVNAERAKVDVAPLKWNEEQARVGRAHSRDMFERGYFSHYSPEGKDVGDRLTDAGINYGYAGENLALAPNVDRANTGLINSEGHRRNILDPAFKEIGIGAMDGGVYGKMFTQVFTD